MTGATRGRSLAVALCAAVVAVAAAMGSAPLAAAADLPPPPPAGVTVREVRVDGLLRVEEGTVRGALSTRPGVLLDAKVVHEDLLRLLALGVLEDATIALLGDPDDGVVVVTVVERPVVHAVEIAGNRGLADDRFVDDVVVKAGALLDRADLARTVERMRGHYRRESYPFAEVKASVAPVPDSPGEVDVTFTVTEATRVRVRRITFAGVTAVAPAVLAARMETKEGGPLAWLLESGKLSLEELERDVDRIEAVFLDAGYLAVKVHPASVTLDAGRRLADVRFRVEEGARYRAGAVAITGDLPGTSAAALAPSLRVRAGDWFSRPAMGEDAEGLARHFRDEGRAGTVVTPRIDVDGAARTVAVTYDVRPGPVVRIGRIAFTGNRATRERVLRARLAIAEGDRFSETRVARSRAELEKTGWFDAVTVSSRTGAAPDLLELVFEVKEAKTGSAGVSVDSSGGENFVIVQFANPNLFGWGVSLAARFGYSLHRLEWGFVYADPRFLDTPLHLTAETIGTTFVLTDFGVERRGGSVTAGWPLTRSLHLGLRYGLHDLELSRCGYRGCVLDDDSVRSLFRDGRVSALALVLEVDAVNDPVHPTRGLSGSFAAEVADPIVGSRLAYTRLRAVARFYWPLVAGAGRGGGVILKLFARGTVVLSNGTGDVPLSERLFEGGIGSIRGFASRSLGPLARLRGPDPTDPLRLVNIGGVASLVVSAEIEVPILPRSGLRGVVFLDAGNAWGGLTAEPDVVLPASPLVRVAAGGGFRLLLPFGALRLEVGVPLERDPLRRERPVEIFLAVGAHF